ncbi:kinase-like domain-containing protein [Mycotypha africana]|uniref:kinase-like domain-containing protein n=1 Tax=Mycotypha africana TaxID=64632 RepID=UPI0022FFCFAB|nr:kinase-like domain-containing protein [Mycotypha africana]KAI8975346.1 kinase-like domain-containing protein [Mycotypha africana]
MSSMENSSEQQEQEQPPIDQQSPTSDIHYTSDVYKQQITNNDIDSNNNAYQHRRTISSSSNNNSNNYVDSTFSISNNSNNNNPYSNYYAPLSQSFDANKQNNINNDTIPITMTTTAHQHEYNNYPTRTSFRTPTTTEGMMTANNNGGGHHELINDQSHSLDAEAVVEVSPNERYVRLNTLLGKGAYKVVYKAIDREEGYEVAWNTMQAMASLNNNKDLEHEIQILKSVRHPNIIAFHDAWYGENEFVFVTELMTSGTLREYIRKLAPLPNLKIIKRWSRQILKGLAYLHGHEPPIIHRDIKCDNIFINGAHGEVKIGDMGTAEMKLGKKYTLIGTPEFMAPEMYEEKGYNEKVDIYAFGMCLLEMVTGEYPYGECRNAAQIYKKVSAGIKPAALSKVHNPEILNIIESCLGPEDQRMSAQEILEHSFLAVEPDVVLLAADPDNIHLTLQVVFKGMDKLSVKFDFNVETDTAEEVVREMIDEQVLPERYQQHITKEINRILRDINKPTESEQVDQVHRSVWRRESDIRTELDRTRRELNHATDRVLEIEQKCEDFETRARAAESRYREALRSLRELEELKMSAATSPVTAGNPNTPTTSAAANEDEGQRKASIIDSMANMYIYTGHAAPPAAAAATAVPAEDREREKLVNHILDEYSDDTDISVFVGDCAQASHRSIDKAHEWARKLQNQDIMTVGDLRDLHDEDWAGIGLTVFALRALKNMLKGKRLAAAPTGNTMTSISTSTNNNNIPPPTPATPSQMPYSTVPSPPPSQTMHSPPLPPI